MDYDKNPMVRCYGYGPEGKKCKDCAELYQKQVINKYYKCRKRGDDGSANTDQRLGWNACKYFKVMIDAQE
jgi:hypothetical protein